MAYSQDLRNKVIEMYKNNQTRLAISQVFKIRYETICEWISRYNKTGLCDLKRDSKLGRRRNFDDKEAVLACIEANPDISGKEIKEKLAPNISKACFYKSTLYGWSLRGVKSFAEVLGHSTVRKTLIAGYSYGSKQLIAPMEYDGYTDTAVFN